MLRATAHREKETILAHLEQMAALADAALAGPSDDIRRQLATERRFITDELVPYAHAVEATLYPELRSLLRGVCSLSPMRRDHRELDRLAALVSGYAADIDAGRFGCAERTGLRRALYRLCAILTVHLGEEDRFIGVLEDGLAARKKAALARTLSHAGAAPS